MTNIVQQQFLFDCGLLWATVGQLGQMVECSFPNEGEISGCGFESRCSHLNSFYIASHGAVINFFI